MKVDLITYMEIYQIAKKKDQIALNKLLAKGVCIDQLRDANSLLTPAALLAKEGLRSSAEFLKKNGALDIFVGYGAALGGQVKYAEYLRINDAGNLDLNLMAQGAAEGGYIGYADQLCYNWGASCTYMVKGALKGGYLNNAEKIYQFLLKIRFDHVRKQIIHQLKREFLIRNKFTIKSQIPKIEKAVAYAKKFNRYHTLNYNHAILLSRKGQFEQYATWFLQGKQLLQMIQNFPYELFLLISQHYTGLSAQQTSAFDKMFEKYRSKLKFVKVQKELLSVLLPFTQLGYRRDIPQNQKQQAKHYMNKIKKIKSMQGLKNWLKTIFIVKIKDNCEKTVDLKTKLSNEPILNLLFKNTHIKELLQDYPGAESKENNLKVNDHSFM